MSSSPADAQPDDLRNTIQTQLAELLRGQERLENIITTFASNLATPRSFGFANAHRITPRITPRNGIRASRVASEKSKQVKMCKVATAKGDSSVTPRFFHPEDNSVDGQKLAPYTILEPNDLGVAMNGKVAIIDESTMLALPVRNTIIGTDDEAIGEHIMANFEESRSAFERSKQRLRSILKVCHEVKRREREQMLRKEHSVMQKKDHHLQYVMSADAHRKEIWFDAVVQVVIVLNTFFIGLSLDFKHKNDWNFWLIADMVFTAVFLVELFLKLFLHGFKQQFLGPDKFSNGFDFLIIVVDTTQLIGTFQHLGKEEAKVRSASVLRVARLLRIVRIIRSLQFKGMRAFVDMLQGILDGAATLFWAILMFMLMVYCGGIICKICFGTASTDEEEMKTVYPYFKSVSRSMLTVFRCSFGDCSTAGGTPIAEFILEENGKEYALGYCLFLFFISIGLFNIISAIFVDSTMTASSAVQTAIKNERLNSQTIWATSVVTILGELLQVRDIGHSKDEVEITPDNMEENFDALVKIEFTRSMLEEAVMHNLIVQGALDGLDIEPNDHKRLSDILDPDHSGTIDVLELVDGLHCLRGDPRRSDVVTCDLMIRSLQAKTDEVLAEVLDMKDRCTGLENAALVQKVSN
jgi:hypothetical protein